MSEVIFDETLPTLTDVTITSDNADPTLARVGDTITLNITADETLNAPPIVAIASQLAVVTGTGPYVATYTMTATDPPGVINFTINFFDEAGNSGLQVSAPTDPTNIVTFDNGLPVATTVNISSNNVDPTIANFGNEITLAFTVSEALIALPVATIDGQTAVVTNVSGLGYEATYTATTINPGNLVDFTLDFTDTAGNIATTVIATSDGSAVTFISGEITLATSSFDEALSNDGSVSSSISVSLVGDVFTGTPGENFFATGKVNVINVPAGLTPSLIRNSDDQITFTLTGNATAHESSDSISNMSLVFLDAAFINAPAAMVINSTTSGLILNYLDAPEISYTGGAFIEDAADVGTFTTSISMILVGETFAGTNGEDFIASSRVTIINLPTGLIPVVNRDSETQQLRQELFLSQNL